MYDSPVEFLGIKCSTMRNLSVKKFTIIFKSKFKEMFEDNVPLEK